MACKGFKAGSITLDEQRSSYYSGQVLIGSIDFELGKPLTFEAIKVVYIGQSIVKWLENEAQKYSGASRVRQVEYLGRDVYFNTEQVLCREPTTLPAGTHSIKFSYQIPCNIPSSFKGSKGTITYQVKAIIEYQDKDRDELTTDFEVVTPLDLNTVQDIKNPAVLEFEELTTCNCFCQDSIVCIKIVLPVSGYCPGQIMQIKVDSRNDSSVEIRKIIFQFVRRESYRSQQPQSKYTPPEMVLDTMVQGPILANTKRSFTCQMKVPDIIAYNLESCNIIDLGYFLKVKVKMSGCVDDLEDECELCIGLIPLKETVTDSYVHPLSHLLPQSAPPSSNNIPKIPIQAGVPINQTPYTTMFAQNSVSFNSQTPYVSTTNIAPHTTTPYEIGFKIPNIVVEPPYPINSGIMPSQNISHMPSAPPI